MHIKLPGKKIRRLVALHCCHLLYYNEQIRSVHKRASVCVCKCIQLGYIHSLTTHVLHPQLLIPSLPLLLFLLIEYEYSSSQTQKWRKKAFDSCGRQHAIFPP